MWFVSKKAPQPPLGMLTVANMLPGSWEKRLVDLNVKPLRDADLEWAEVVLISAMSIQRKSTEEVIARCKKAGVRTVAGGPLFTSEQENFGEVDHLVLNEAEVTLPMFLADFEKGEAKRVYTSDEWADMTEAKGQALELVDMKKYVTMGVQYSRGCPFDCEFCDISVLFGRKVRTKSTEQMVAELEELYSWGWRGGVFFVDDNFIGNAKKLKGEVLPAIIEWMKENGRPFVFQTQASINLADDEELMRMMVQAGFDSVFVGIETTNEESLEECNKRQNTNRDMLESVKSIQRAGLQVTAGFIVGFDNDTEGVFDRMATFIQKSGIVTAMVGLLNAPRHTRLHRRLEKEGRLLKDMTGDNTDGSMNFVPKMDRRKLMEGYRRLVEKLYTPGRYYERVRKCLKEYRIPRKRYTGVKASHVGAFLKSIVRLGILGRERYQYWKLFVWTLVRRPRSFPTAMTLAIHGFHYRRFFRV